MTGQMDLLIVRGGIVRAPEYLGEMDLAVAGGRIIGIGEQLSAPGAVIIDASGATVVPGFIDGHAHLLGGGGAGGPTSRSPEMGIGGFLAEGITAAVGCIGYDTTSRTLPGLLIKARELELYGLSVYCFTGGFGFPPPTVLQDVERDLALIDRFVGVKVAIGEPASGMVSREAFTQFVAAARRGGRLAGKAGLIHAHMGTQDSVQFLMDLAEYGVPPSAIVATHVNRNEQLLRDSARWGTAGGTVDVTSQEPAYYDDAVPTGEAVSILLELGVRQDRISVSSDSGSSVARSPGPDRARERTVVTPAGITAVNEMIKSGVPIETALATMTATPARKLRLARKGRLAVGNDADVSVLNSDLTIRHLLVNGKVGVCDGAIQIRDEFS